MGSLRNVEGSLRKVWGGLWKMEGERRREGRKFAGSMRKVLGLIKEYPYYHDGVLFFKNVTGFLKKTCVVKNVLCNHLHWGNRGVKNIDIAFFIWLVSPPQKWRNPSLFRFEGVVLDCQERVVLDWCWRWGRVGEWGKNGGIHFLKWGFVNPWPILVREGRRDLDNRVVCSRGFWNGSTVLF